MSFLVSFRLPTFKTRPLKAATRHLRPRATIFISERLPVRDRILGLERARPVRDRLINVIMWEKPLLSSCARNRPFRRRNPEERFRSLFFLKEIPLAMETVPESGTSSASSTSTRDPAVWPRDPEYPSLAPTINSVAPSTSFLLRRMVCIVPTLRCVYALSTLIMNASVSSAARVLTRRAQVHGRSTLHGGDAFFFRG